MIKQITSLTSIFLRSLPARLGSSFIIVAGIGGVVAVMVALFAMANGFEQTLKTTGHADRALILRAGSTSEINGNIPLEQFRLIRDLPQVAVGEEPLASRETFVTVNMLKRGSKDTASLPMRGVIEASFRVRSEVSVIAGRSFETGKYEVVVGKSAAVQFEGLDVGASVRIRGVDWHVVGVFDAKGSAYESEIWVDERLLAQSWQRGETFSSMLVKLNSAQKFELFQTAVEADRRLTVEVMRESDYYANQARGTTDLITGVGMLVGTVMALGAIFAALNTMFTALATRGAEIATYRALGFHRGSIVCAVLVESVALGGIGALLGGGLVLLLFNGVSLSTVAATSTAFTQVAFQFTVTPKILANGLMLAGFLGFAGGLFPAIGAARRPITKGLQRA